MIRPPVPTTENKDEGGRMTSGPSKPRRLAQYELDHGCTWLCLPSSESPEWWDRRNTLILSGKVDRKILSRKTSEHFPDIEVLELEWGHTQSFSHNEEHDAANLRMSSLREQSRSSFS